MKYLILVVVLLLACSDDKPTEIIFGDNTPPADEGVTRTFDASSYCYDCTGSSALQFCVDIVGYQELVSFKCAQDLSQGCLANGPNYCKCRGKRYLTMVTCWKAR